MNSHEPVEIHEGVLACPSCYLEDGTHVDRVFALTRNREDDEPLYLSLDGTGVMMPVAESQYPKTFADTGRRQEFVLGGWCELCGKVWTIALRQHKGRTLIGMRVGPRGSDQ